MIHSGRTFIGGLIMKIGFLVVPADVREMVRKLLLYHVPGALSSAEKSEVETAKSDWEAFRS